MKKSIVLVVVLLGLLCWLAAPALASAKTIIVKPIGNDQTAAIQAAFTAAGPGGTVQLTTGHFYISDLLVTGFRGTFKGAGQSKTVIDTPPGGVSVRTVDIPPIGPQTTAFLLGFQDGVVRVSDLSFHVTPPAPTTWPDGTHALAEDVFLFGETSAAFDHVGFAAEAGGYFGFNTDQAVLAVPDAANAGGSYSADDCTFATPEGFVAYLLSRSRIDVGSSRGNVFTSQGVACGLYDLSASSVTVANNRFQNGNAYGNPTFYSAGVNFGQDPGLGLTPSRCLVSNNSFRVGPPADAVDLWDSGFVGGEGQLLDATIAHNTMVLSGSLDLTFVQNPGGIGEYYAQGVRVLDNRISGTGAAAIYLGTAMTDDATPGSVSGWKIIGNNVQHMIPLPQSAGGPGAPIWLGKGTSGCTVIGGCTPTRVFDEGSGNTLINVTPATASLVAPALSMRASALPSKLGLMQRLRQAARP
jgi:hypothetical protein